MGVRRAAVAAPSRQRYSQRIACPDGDDPPREAADAVRDGARLGARVPRHDGRDRGAAADGGGPRARPQRSAMGLPGVRALALGLLPRRRRDRRPRRPPAHVHRRRHPLRPGVAAHRARAERGRADRRPGAAGSRRRRADDDEPRAAPGDLGGRGGPGDRPLDLPHEPRDGGRAAARRRHRADDLVALGLPDQRAAGGPHGRARARRARRRPRDARAARRSTSSARASSPSASSGSPTRSSRCARRDSRRCCRSSSSVSSRSPASSSGR